METPSDFRIKMSTTQQNFPVLRPEKRLNRKQLLDDVEQNIICQWRADKLFADAEDSCK